MWSEWPIHLGLSVCGVTQTALGPVQAQFTLASSPAFLMDLRCFLSVKSQTLRPGFLWGY